MYRLSRMVERGMSQLHGWDATTDTVYAFAAIVIVYIFIVVSRDRVRVR